MNIEVMPRHNRVKFETLNTIVFVENASLFSRSVICYDKGSGKPIQEEEWEVFPESAGLFAMHIMQAACFSLMRKFGGFARKKTLHICLQNANEHMEKARETYSAFTDYKIV